MEDAIYYATIAAVIAFGLYGGKHLACSMGEAVLIGLGGTTIAVVAFLGLIVVSSVFSPDSLTSRGIGIRLGALQLFGSALGMVSAIGGRRLAEKAAARLF
jgi:hypothetical protein